MNVHDGGESSAVGVLRDVVVAAAADAVIILDRELRLIDLRGSVFARHGHHPEQMLGRLAGEVLPAAAWARLRLLYERALCGETLTVDWDPHDRLAVYEISFAPIKQSDVIIGCLAAARDVTEIRRAAVEIEATNRLLEVMFDSAPIGKFVTRIRPDGDVIIIRCNPAFARLLGRGSEDILGHRTSEFLHPDDLVVRDEVIRRLREDGEALVEVRWVRADGRLIWTENCSVVAPAPDGGEIQIVQCTDVTDRKLLEQRLRYVADHDSLTGLLTRRRFEEELERELSRVQRFGRCAAVLMIDLDGFKTLNDTLGHAAGDRALIATADALAGTLRQHDILARFGGDEFAAILPETTAQDAEAVAGRLLRAAQTASHSISASIGLTDISEQRSATASELVAQADRAMYKAKTAGGNRVHVTLESE